jgi:RNA polymerase sigma-70 factor (ECF subfamily)
MLKRTDAELVAVIQRGDNEAFEELMQRYVNKAYGLAARLTKNREDAEEVLQDVFITVHRKISAFEGKSSFSSWLYRITVNAALMKLRKRRNDRHVHIEDVVPEYSNSTLLKTCALSESDVLTDRQTLLSALEMAIRKLPDEYRPVFVLRDIDGLTSRQVGKILQLSIPAVKSRLHRSRIMLRRKLLPLYREVSEQARAHIDREAA